MNKVIQLRETILSLFRSGAGASRNQSEMLKLLDGLDFHDLLQSVSNDMEPIYQYYAFGTGTEDCEYYGPELTPMNAALLFEDVTEYTAHSADCTRSLELWLLADMSLAVVSCFNVTMKGGNYVSAYRTFKGRNWRDAGMMLDFSALADSLGERCEKVRDGKYPIYEV